MPSGLPGFLRRSLRVGYDEENDDDGDEGADDDDRYNIDHDYNNYIDDETNLNINNNKGNKMMDQVSDNKSVDITNQTNSITTTGGNENTTSNTVVTNSYNVSPQPIRSNQSMYTTPSTSKRTIQYKHRHHSTNDSSGECDMNDEDEILQSLSQHHQQQQEDIYNMSQTSSPGSSVSNGFYSPSSTRQVLSQATVMSSGRVTSNSPVGKSSITNSGSVDRNLSSSTSDPAVSSSSSSKPYRERQFEKVLNADVININELRALAWNGIPIQYRAMTWKLLVGYVPVSASRRAATIKRKRKEYIESCVLQHWSDVHDDTRPIQEQEVLRQVLVDVPRTQPSIPLFRNDKIKRLLSRLLFIWAMRHPASSYVQGINDLTTPLIAVFLTDYFINTSNTSNSTENNSNNSEENEVPSTPSNNTDDHETGSDNYDIDANSNHTNEQQGVNDRSHSLGRSFPVSAVTMSPISYFDGIGARASTTNDNSGNGFSNMIHNYDFLRELPDIVLEGHVMNQFPDDKLDELEADVYWCLTNLLAGIQDHYTADQPGVQRMVGRLEELVNRIDANLCRHLQETGIMFIQFSFKWMNCLLLREFTLKCVYRLWDTYLSEISGFEDFHVYVCAAFLCQFSTQLQTMQFDELFTFLQQIPTTKDWTDIEISILLSQAFVLSTLFRNSDAHLTSIQR